MEIMKSNQNKEAILALEDGTIFVGHTSGIDKTVCGEVVFNTSMTGYQEICTDPSYANQIVLFTTTQIGNVGVNQKDYESERAWIKGIIVLEMSKKSSNWRSEKDFVTFLEDNRITWIEGIDTRKLTRHLRDKGIKNGCIMVGKIDTNLAIKLAKRHVKAEGLDLSREAIKEKPYEWHDENTLGLKRLLTKKPLKRIVVYDFGVKSNILRKLSSLGCSVTVVPSTSTIEDILSLDPDGIVISNGPGDPASMKHGIGEVRKLISTGIPVFGICLGCQLIALAIGGETKKMKFGHHGANHPVYDLKKKEVYITSQNHSFVIDEKTLPRDFVITHKSLFDGSIQGIRSKEHPVFGFQGHPEGSPGPQDIGKLFEEFLHEVGVKDALRSYN